MGERPRPSPLLRLMLRLTPRPTPGCTTTVLDTPPILMVMVTMAIIWVTLVTTVTILVTLDTDIMDILWATTARGPPRLNQLLRLMLRLTPRPTPGCTTTVLDTPPVLMDTVTMAIIWVTLPMLDITPTLTTEAAEMGTEPWFPAPPGNSVEVSALV